MQFRDSFEEQVQAELDKATAGHGPMASAHEAYAVILEELDEWWDEVKDRNHDGARRAFAIHELIQLAAMVRRAARDVYGLGLPDVPAALTFDPPTAAALDQTGPGRRAVEALNRAADARKDQTS